jgi:putative flavoprotein involved in K+ transport
MSEQTEVVVVGGGQAGLAAGYYLKQAAIPFVVLDAAPRGGQSWRERWDSLELFTPAGYSGLPGMPFPGEPERYPGKDEVAAYLESYASKFELPVRHCARVTSLERLNDGYLLVTDSRTLEARQVIVATGAYQQPYTPLVAEGLSDEVTQLHSAAYRNPEQVPAGAVLVVGSANSGAQIARELAVSHRVYLSRGTRIPSLPLRLLGKDLHWYGDKLGLITAPLDTWRGRTQRGDLLIGTSLRQLRRRHGVELHARAVGAHGTTVQFADDRSIDVGAVVWATGYRSDYSWIDVSMFDEHGAPRHRRGVTESAGLYLLGMSHQHSRGSSLIHWVRHDAEFIVGQLRDRRAPPGATRPYHQPGRGVVATEGRR